MMLHQIAQTTGRLYLEFRYDEALQLTRLAYSEQEPPLKVVRAFALSDAGVLVHLHNVSGGVLGGDQLALSVKVGAQARVQLTSTSATRIYRTLPEKPMAVQETRFEVGENALLEYLPDPLIPFAGSRYRQDTRIFLAPGAGLFWWECVAPGRVAHNELFAYDLLSLRTEITGPERLLAKEQMLLEPRLRPLSTLARLGPYHYFASFYICRVGQENSFWSQLERELVTLALDLSREEVIWGVSTLTAHGLVVRALSREGRAILSGVQAFWTVARRALYGMEALPPRKIY